MHPILFRIPLPHRPLMLWWALAAIAVVALGVTAVSLRRNDRGGALTSAAVMAAMAGAAFALRDKSFEAENLPIYSYGVMLGLSLVVGWYLTLGLAERDGLPKEQMANCYVVTALSAIVASRLLYVVTNLGEFENAADLFAFRRGGLVAYGGFLGGFVGSWIYLGQAGLRLMPWADVAVPSLASGLMITRIGCYLFGCDFGKRLTETAPDFLKKAGTFPHWAQGTVGQSDGSPAFVRHMELYRGTEIGSEVVRTNASLPVHPTQIYESVLGLVLLAFLLWQRKHQRFRGQIFLSFVFYYGVGRFLLEILRDDVERGEYGPRLPEHIMISGALLLFALAFAFGMSVSIRNVPLRTAARVLSFLPAPLAYVLLRPESFGQSAKIQLSTSQWIALVTALLVSYFYATYWDESRQNPQRAMDTGYVPPANGPKKESSKEEGDDEGEDDETSPEQRKENPLEPSWAGSSPGR